MVADWFQPNSMSQPRGMNVLSNDKRKAPSPWPVFFEVTVKLLD